MTQYNPSKDLRDYLIANGVTTDIFINQEPTDPIDCITIYDTSEQSNPNPKFLIDYPSLQIRSRSSLYETAYANLLEIFDLLHGVDGFTENTTNYISIIASTNIFSLGNDDNDNNILVCNFNIISEPQYTSQNRKQLT
jgi:hypothetical protein